MVKATEMQVMLSAIKRRLAANGGDGVVVLVTANGITASSVDLMADVEVARNSANAALNRNDQELVWGAPAEPSPKGPILSLDWIGTDEELEEWLDLFAATLTTFGRSGSVSAAPQAHFPKALDPLFATDRLVSSLAFTLPVPTPYGYPPFTWLVDGATTREVVEHAIRWGRIPGASVYVAERTSQFLVDDSDPTGMLTAAVERSGLAGLAYLHQPTYELHFVRTRPLGEVVYQAASVDRTWKSFMELSREPLRYHGAKLDLAFIRLSRSSVPTFLDQGQLPPPPGIQSVGDFTRNRHLYDSYVPDAHAVQVLTAKHLAKAHDLSRWSTEALGNDRYLVEARDLGPWFSDSEHAKGNRQAQPDSAVVAEARHDFGRMILTQSDLEADPLAWLPGRPPRPITKTKPTSSQRKS